jgi:hypothetical protein
MLRHPVSPKAIMRVPRLRSALCASRLGRNIRSSASFLVYLVGYFLFGAGRQQMRGE